MRISATVHQASEPPHHTPKPISDHAGTTPTAGVALQWARWCRSPGYIANAFGKEVDRTGYDQFRAPIFALYASDDPIATPANVRDLLRLFPLAPKETRVLEPQEFGDRAIGHIDYFRKSRCALRPLITQYLKQ